MVRNGVLLLAYGTPKSLKDVEAYLTHIRHGRRPSPELVGDIRRRYVRIGGHSPLLEITMQQADALCRRLREKGVDVEVVVGMKYSPPFIHEAVKELDEAQVEKVMALPLSPYYSRVSIGEYESALNEAMKQHQAEFPLNYVKSWQDHPFFLKAWAAKVRRALNDFRGEFGQSPTVLFTAHSLPKRILKWNDQYPSQLEEVSRKISKLSEIEKWEFSYQSASQTGEEWLGPDILETIRRLSRLGQIYILVVPIGFVSDNLEVLYDIDVESQELAESLGVALKRTESLNADPMFIEALADIATKHLQFPV